ncbi:MAG TPA: class II aldolase/adducin family protein [Candidatus Acidoferrales bacterium]|nr:class II aldolase/adducin family protein [Candidatus Acidoferrales bacterium]
MTITRRELIAASAALAGFLSTVAAAEAEPPAGPSAEALLNDLVTANHFLADREIVDGYGHVSVRDPQNPNQFLMARAIAPALVTRADILTYDLDSNPLNSNGADVYSERFIHGETYRARPDVIAVIHSHALELIPFGVTGVILRPIYHMGSFIGPGVPIFEIRTAREANDNSMLIHTASLANALARTLGSHPAALIRGHGAVIVGSSLGQTVARSVYLVENASMQAKAMALGQNITYLDANEARSMADNPYDRDWNLWKRLPKTG